MGHYFLSPGTARTWSRTPAEFAAAVAEAWPDAELFGPHRPGDGTEYVSVEMPESHGYLSASYHVADNGSMHLSADGSDLRSLAAFFAWTRHWLGPDNPGVFFTPESDPVTVPLDAQEGWLLQTISST